MVTELLIESANLMLIGMVSVFCFLWLLVLAVGLLSKVMQRYFPTPAKEKYIDNIPAASTAVSPAIVAAITAAIHQHRQQH
ncbi:OadG family protein [Rheinheimera salexigens]|uniref:Probable oxaloacetate decarboxylase gamma chain n=1 Tax=Rheinheimera salexigens TaxID=1628148 RepID=A0A1E7Q8J0_9GAMM|nr:OadG family transporter subunit [Rheinheimera salexigens]OEY70456.1 oxaloacetate decarboxylase [Rheinheimera salexigens]